MSAQYKTRVSADLIDAWDLNLLPEGMRIVDVAEDDPIYLPYRIVTFEDDDAPEELNGMMVTPLFQIQPDRSVIIVGRQIDVPVLYVEVSDEY